MDEKTPSKISEEQGMSARQENDEQEETVSRRETKTTNLESQRDGDRQRDGRQEGWREEGDGLLADDGDEDGEGNGRSLAFTPLVRIVKKTTEKQTECLKRDHGVRDHDVRGYDVSTQWEKGERPPRSCCACCGETMSSVVFLLMGAVMFPLLVWGGHDLLPLDLPMVRSAPSRLVYTLRCALFAAFPIILGVLVHGVSRLKFSSLNPLFEGKRSSRHTLVHMTFVQDSLRLSLLFFVQLAVMSTYIQPNALKLVPLLTIVFVFGRLIYWPSVCFGSSVRALGFSLSFMPVLALMGLNLYFICSVTGQGAVFDVAPPTTPPPPKARWWG